MLNFTYTFRRKLAVTVNVSVVDADNHRSRQAVFHFIFNSLYNLPRAERRCVIIKKILSVGHIDYGQFFVFVVFGYINPYTSVPFVGKRQIDGMQL